MTPQTKKIRRETVSKTDSNAESNLLTAQIESMIITLFKKYSAPMVFRILKKKYQQQAKKIYCSSVRWNE